jgi:transcriptional regulator with XRE-family HTH domain
MGLSRKRSPAARRGCSGDDRASVLGNRLKEERLLAGLSETELGRRIGVEGATVHQYETGERRMNPERLVGVLRALGLPISVFFYPLQSRVSALRAVDRPYRVAALRPPRLLAESSPPEFRSVMRTWEQSRGLMSRELLAGFIAAPMARRIVLLRQPSGSRRLLVEHFTTAVAALKPCQAISLVGRPLAEMPDGDFGRWLTEGYAETLFDLMPRLEGVLADIRASDENMMRSRYDRLLLPWQSRGDRFVLSVSVVRQRHVISEEGSTEGRASDPRGPELAHLAGETG